MGHSLAVLQEIPFHQRLEGRFDGMIRQADLTALGDEVARWDGWYVVEPHLPLPRQTVDGITAKQMLEDLVAEILQVERGVWTTMVYVQSFADPWIIKVFHPRRAGCGCGVGGGVMPWRVFSRFEPGPVPAWEAILCGLSTPDKASASWWRRKA
ncbi:MAG: hypothetical protein H7839_11395 [Magnetococcus sp. YQC-5]